MYNYQLQFLLVALAGWINRHQQDVIEYLKEESCLPAPSINVAAGCRHPCRSNGN
jgi:hypothetical protein